MFPQGIYRRGRISLQTHAGLPYRISMPGLSLTQWPGSCLSTRADTCHTRYAWQVVREFAAFSLQCLQTKHPTANTRVRYMQVDSPEVDAAFKPYNHSTWSNQFLPEAFRAAVAKQNPANFPAE